jgi:TPP-dependent pyruvate/acetoin dehydrogenase alpha subunit
LALDKTELTLRKREETLTHAETIFSLFSRRRRSLSTSLSKRRMTERAKVDVEESEDTIEALQQEMERLETDEEAALHELRRKWLAVVDEVTEVAVKPYKKDINTAVFGVVWLPYYEENGESVPAFVME